METHGDEGQAEDRLNMPSTLAQQRAAAVLDTVAQVRALLGQDAAPGLAPAQCAAACMQTLAAQTALWDSRDFPIEGDRLWQAYTLHEDADGAYAMYAVAMHPGHAQPPHDHTTWALIAGVRGAERNTLYRRPQGSGPAPLAHLGDITVAAGYSLALGPTDLHAIEVPGPGDALHLHLYGRGFAHLQERRIFDLLTGESRAFPAIPNIS